MRRTTCRSCESSGLVTFLDLGEVPLADGFVAPENLDRPEGQYPLVVAFCPTCSLVQIIDDVPAETLFADGYLYFSSFSDHLLKHSREHALDLIERRSLGAGSLVVELASNDGYLLRNFVEAGIPVLGIDPAEEPAKAAEAIGVPTLVTFFGASLATALVAEGKPADVIIAKNVMAHVPDLNGFVAGMKILLAEDGIIEVENPYVADLIDHCEFDTIYHEHMCYYSCTSVDALMRRHGLWLNDVRYFPDLHGGTLRWTMGHTEDRSATVMEYLARERERGLDTADFYLAFSDRVNTLRAELLSLLRGLKADRKTIAGYGAAAKGTTMVNFCGIGSDLVEFVVDRNVHKQGFHVPGTHQPILDPAALLERQPDYTLLLAWNFAEEIVAQQGAYRALGGRFIRPVPHPEILP